jgi:hypothetical protein
MTINNIHFNPLFFSNGRFSSSAQGGWDVYWLIGQSNMIGRATIRTDVDDDYSSISGRVFQFGYSSQTVTAATNPLDHVNENAGQMGLWLEFVKARLPKTHASRNILLVPCAQGGTSFSANNWNPGNTLYNAALARLASAMANGSGTNILRAALWLQGESDADAGDAAANAYLAKLQAMYDAMKINASGMSASTPFLVGTIKPDKSRATIINASLNTFCVNNSAAHLVDLTDQSFIDADHYTAASLAVAGKRFASVLQ